MSTYYGVSLDKHTKKQLIEIIEDQEKYYKEREQQYIKDFKDKDENIYTWM